MDSQLASVLTRGSLDVQNGSQCAEGSGPVTKMCVNPEDRVHLPAAPGNLQPPVTAAQTIRTPAPSVNGQQPEVGGTSQPSSQEHSQIGGFRQPITVKTVVPVVDNQPMRIKIVVPPRHKGPITNSAISLTKDFTFPHPREPVMLSEKNWAKTHTSVVTTEGDTEVELYHVTEGEKRAEILTGKGVLDVKIVHIDGLESHTIPRTNTVKIEREMRKNLPLILQDMGLISRNTFNELRTEEQTEPLDLSLPNKREDRERRCGRIQDDSGGAGSLIMEVDEYEGDGDRDIVEEDEDGTMDICNRCVLKDSFLSTPALASLSVEDCNSKDLLLIDDQGIPYTLSHDGHKIPQVDISPSSTDPQSDRAGSPGTERTEESPEGTSSGPSFSQSSDTALKESSLDLYPSSTPASDRSLLGTDQTAGPEVMEGMTNPEHSVVVEPNSCVQEAVFNSSSLISTSTQPVQMLTNPSINVPFLLLSPSSSSAPVSLPLSLSVPQSSPGASTPMFLLLSSVPSSSGESTSTSTPIAVLDPSTGQLSQITAASAPISLPLSSGQVGALGSHVSNPVITLSANNAPALVSGTSNVKSSSVLTSVSVPSPVHTQGSAPLSQTHISHSDSNPGSEAIPVKDVSSEMNKQSTVPESSPQAQPSSVTYDPSTQPSSEASAHTPASESNVTPSDHLPLDDHRYFTNTAAPPSPPIGPMFPPANLDPLDPLDPISPSGSPDSMNSRRVLYCPLCPRVFFYLSDLERHAITHSQKKPHVCQQCGKAFKRSSHLQRHKHIHTGQRNFVCPICAKRFREAGELQRHQRVHTGEKPYQCQLCHTRFAERNTLRRHTKRKHPYHQAAMEMLSERKDRGGGGRRDDGEVGGSAAQEEEESAEWYSSTVSNLEHSESEVET